MSKAIAYIGTYTRIEPHVEGKAEGIYTCQVDLESGALKTIGVTGGVINPSFVCTDAKNSFLYAVQEIEQFEGHTGGAASAFRIDPQSGTLEIINSQPTHGEHPCYVSIDNTGRWLLVANYGGGSISVLPIKADGSLGEPTAVVKHTEKPTHHNGPHPHSIVAAPGDGSYILVPDCGLDRIYVYKLDTETGTLTPHEQPWTMLAPGDGPRHISFDASGKFVYCVNERSSSLSVLSYDQAKGTLELLQTVSTLPADFTGGNSCADIHISADGRFVYGTNRGHNSLAIFAIDQNSGLVEALGHCSTEGRTPRNFAIVSDELVLAANQDSSTIVPLKRDPATGGLSSLGSTNEVFSPVCVHIVR